MIFLMLTIACTSVSTSEQQENSLERISSTEKISTIDDFISIGFKVYKEYDVSELVRAESAWHGMWKDQTDRIDFEVRVYQTHFDAVEYGVPFADNVVGKDAVVKKSESIWPEGLKDRIKLIEVISNQIVEKDDLSIEKANEILYDYLIEETANSLSNTF